MKKKYRLLKKIDFQFLLRNGNKTFTPHFICYWKQDLSLTNIKIGLIVPKKKCKLACDRKKYKRVFWALNNHVLDDLPRIKCVFFYKDVFFERYGNGNVSFFNLREEYMELMRYLSKKTKQ